MSAEAKPPLLRSTPRHPTNRRHPYPSHPTHQSPPTAKRRNSLKSLSPENLPKQPNHLRKRLIRCLRIKPRPLIPRKRMLRRIQNRPIPRPTLPQRSVNRLPPHLRHVRIKRPKNHQQLAANLLRPPERSRIRILSQLPIMNSSPVITNRRPHIRLNRCAKRQMPANTKSHRSSLPPRHPRMRHRWWGWT